MPLPRLIIVRLAVPACLAIAGVEARAQAPTDLPALPEAPAPFVVSPGPGPGFAPFPPLSPEVAPSSAPVGCTPGHCSHRSFLARSRCKRHLQEAFLGFPEEFERPPLGARMHEVNTAQVRKGEASALTLYSYDFVAGTARLKPRGQDRLAEIGARMPFTFQPVLIQRSGEPGLDEKRRESVLESLALSPFPIPPERVVVGRAPTRALRGDEALILHQGALYRTEQAGPRVSTGTTSSSPANQP